MSLTTSILLLGFVFCDVFMQVVGEYCQDYGQNCPVGLSCCGTTCCARENYHHGFRWSVWNMWYFWFIVIFILMSCFGGCGYWRRRQLMLHQQQAILQHQQVYNNYVHQAAFSVSPHTAVPIPPYPTAGPPPSVVQPEGSFPAPPPYSEVTKPYYYSPNKDDLPPYPEHPYSSEFSNIMPPPVTETGATGVLNNVGTMPGLPAYSAVADVPPASYQPPADYQGSSPLGQVENQSTAAATMVAPPVASSATVAPSGGLSA